MRLSHWAVGVAQALFAVCLCSVVCGQLRTVLEAEAMTKSAASVPVKTQLVSVEKQMSSSVDSALFICAHYL